MQKRLYQHSSSSRSSSKTSFSFFEDVIPRLSVIICTYNRRNFLLATLASMRKQTLPAYLFEVLVIDNGSTDGTLEAVDLYMHADFMHHTTSAKHCRIRCLQELQHGLSFARNTGWQSAAGEILVFLDDDTLVDTFFLERLLNTYEETGATAVGGCIELRWECPRPYWLGDDFLDLLGYFRPFYVRAQLPVEMSMSSCAFSVRRSALEHVGGFVPYLGKQPGMPLNVEVAYLCQCLRSAGYTLWYEPAAIVLHRVTSSRTSRAFLVGRAYWQGRGEVLTEFACSGSVHPHPTLRQAFRAVLPDIRAILYSALLHRPLLFLARRSMSERVEAAIDQAYVWGRAQQSVLLADTVPVQPDTPAVLLVRAHRHEAEFLLHGLQRQEISCLSTIATIPFSWLWHYRRRKSQQIRGILHCYRPGAFELSAWRRQLLLFQLWLARRLGIAIVSTDAGGWWQHVCTYAASLRRAFEYQVLVSSSLILSYTSYPTQVYTDRRILSHVRSVSHPGMYGALPILFTRDEARQLLGLPGQAAFVYFCLAPLHSEHEILFLIEAFSQMQSTQTCNSKNGRTELHLLIAGLPADRQRGQKIVQCAALHPFIHLSLAYRSPDLPLYIGAVDALVLPHVPLRQAGTLDIAILFHSYGHTVVVPDLPRFRDTLPGNAVLSYDTSSKAALTAALAQAAQHPTLLPQYQRSGSSNEQSKAIHQSASQFEHVCAGTLQKRSNFTSGRVKTVALETEQEEYMYTCSLLHLYKVLLKELNSKQRRTRNGKHVSTEYASVPHPSQFVSKR